MPRGEFFSLDRYVDAGDQAGEVVALQARTPDPPDPVVPSLPGGAAGQEIRQLPGSPETPS
jgi:hypothetical protein